MFDKKKNALSWNVTLLFWINFLLEGFFFLIDEFFMKIGCQDWWLKVFFYNDTNYTRKLVADMLMKSRRQYDDRRIW